MIQSRIIEKRMARNDHRKTKSAPTRADSTTGKGIAPASALRGQVVRWGARFVYRLFTVRGFPRIGGQVVRWVLNENLGVTLSSLPP